MTNNLVTTWYGISDVLSVAANVVWRNKKLIHESMNNIHLSFDEEFRLFNTAEEFQDNF